MQLNEETPGECDELVRLLKKELVPHGDKYNVETLSAGYNPDKGYFVDVMFEGSEESMHINTTRDPKELLAQVKRVVRHEKKVREERGPENPIERLLLVYNPVDNLYSLCVKLKSSPHRMPLCRAESASTLLPLVRGTYRGSGLPVEVIDPGAGLCPGIEATLLEAAMAMEEDTGYAPCLLDEAQA